MKRFRYILYILVFVPLALFGQDNYSLSFNGVDDYVSIDDNDNWSFLNDNFTISVTFNLSSVTIDHIPLIFQGVQDGSLWSLYLLDSVIYFGAYYDDTYNFLGDSYWQEDTISWEPNENTWYNLVYVNEDGNYSFYVDGILISDGSSKVNGNLSVDNELYFGQYHQGDTHEFLNGNMYQASIWHGALTPDEVQDNFHCPMDVYQLNLVGYWNFNVGSGTIVYDNSVNDNNGVINGANFSEDIPENLCIGCKNPDAINYNENAIEEDEESCIYSQDYVHGLWNEVDDGVIENEYLQEEYNTLNTNSTNSTSSLQQALDTWNTTIDLSAGWNMFGYGCPSSIDVTEGLSNHTESIAIVKDNNGAVYLPEWDFNGVGDLIPGAGYQMKLNQPIEGFSLCDWYVNDIPEDNIVSLQDSIINMHTTNCIENGYCSFDSYNQICISPDEGFDCFGIELISYQVGDMAEGGIVFYIDETGEHGLVAALEDLGTYEWGCYGIAISGANDQAVGTGLQNSLDIVAGCSGENLAAYNALNATTESYTDWFLPSKFELVEMYNAIGNGGPEGNIGDFANDNYWSSSEHSNAFAWFVHFDNVISSYGDYKYHTFRVRVIRSF